MELELTRVDYAIVGVISTNCMQLLPVSGPNEQQKVAVADNDGILQVFSIKKEDISVLFKTLPGPKISSMHLAGASGTAPDKIFIASENEIRGYTRKGKLFLSFDTNLTEPISSMYVLGNELFVCGKHIYNHYRDCKDIGSYLCGDSIVDVIALHIGKTHRMVSLIACEGRMIRTIEHARMTHSIEIESSPTSLCIYEKEQGRKSIKKVFFGTIDGRIGVLDIENTHSFDYWLIKNDKYNGSISCMTSYDFQKGDCKNLIVGRSDGNIEVYTINIEDKLDQPLIIYVYNCNESISSMNCGLISSCNFDEILVTTYTGRIFGLTSEPVADKNVAGENRRFVISTDATQKIVKLKSEVEELQTKLIKEREKYQSLTMAFTNEYSAIPTLAIKNSMILSKVDASYILTIEVPTAIDNVLLQSNVPVDLLDVEKNSAVISYSEADPKSGNHLLATYRCQINTNRLEVRIRTIEGQYGILQAYVTPLLQPKFCQLIKYDIKPLSLHLRIHNFDETRPCNVLTLKGNFSLAEIHAWIRNCIPEVPEKPAMEKTTVLIFQSTFLDTMLYCSYAKGEGEFKSDNISTISILKEFLSKEAANKNNKLEFSTFINDDSVKAVLEIIDPKLRNHRKLEKNIQILTALNELEINDANSKNYLCDRYKSLLDNEKDLNAEFNSQPSYLDRLYGIITDLYIDYYKFKGINMKSKTSRLVDILKDYNFGNLLAMFANED